MNVSVALYPVQVVFTRSTELVFYDVQSACAVSIYVRRRLVSVATCCAATKEEPGV